ncbi:MAG: hypothetical protein IPH16_15855 [Haliscomenobacter sp.]|nr:hypothetical protein [Haliscomenobacter sp.]
MKMNLFLFFFWFGLIQSYSQQARQEVLSSTGGNIKGKSIQVDWTIGELVITTIQNANIQITQGFHQPGVSLTNLAVLPLEVGQIMVFPTQLQMSYILTCALINSGP